MSKVLFTVAVPHTGESRRPSFVISTNNLNAVQISKKGVKLGNTNYNGGFKRFEYSVGGNQAVTKFSLVVNTSALLPHITWATGLPLPVIGGKKKKDKRSSSADASSKRPQRPLMGRRASSMDRIEPSSRRQERIEDGRRRYDDDGRERRRITEGSERRPSRRYDDEDRKDKRSSRYSDIKNYPRRDDRRRDDRRSSKYGSDDDDENDKYSRRSSHGDHDKRSRYSSSIHSEYKPRLSTSTRYGDSRRYDRHKDRLAPLSEVDAYERKYGKEARRRRYKRQEKYDGGEIVDDGPNGVDADDDGGFGGDGGMGDFGVDGDAGDAGADGGD